MVEQEQPKSPIGFPQPTISAKVSENDSSDKWFANDTSSQIKSDDICCSDLLNGSVLSPDETICSPLPLGSTKEGNFLYQDNLTSEILLVNDSSLCDLYCSDRNMTNTNEFLSIVTDKMSSLSDPYSEACSPPSFWGSCPLDVETLKMDDVFQVDEDDLVQSPTLAELNANDESLFDSFDNFDVAFTLEKKTTKPSLLTATLCENTICLKTDFSTERTNLLLQTDSSEKDNSHSKSRLRSSLDPKDLHPPPLIRSDEKSNISSENLTKNIKKAHPFSESSAKASKGKSPENVSALSPTKNETIDSEEDDSEMDCDYSSDADEESEEETKVHTPKHVSRNLLLQKKKSRYFWQYNIQSKGPKAPKMKLDGKSSVPDNFSGVSDPVFTSAYLNKGIKHAGKARRGDGNDLTPNPQKLYSIGLELEKLTSVIEGLVPANELPMNARSKSRKEKNKLASRACRLKKKAQHEANKLKLFGLHIEQNHLLDVINEVKKIIKKNVDNIKQGKVQSNVQAKIEALSMKKAYIEVAGSSADFVNNVLKKVGSGDKTGGLDIDTIDD